MMQDELHFLTLARAARLIRSGRLSPVEYTKALLARIEALDPQLSAFVTLTPEAALQAAQQAERDIVAGHYRGPLHGMPFALKDIFDTAGIPTTGCSAVSRNRIPARDAESAARLRRAGGVLLGKLTTHEYAHGGPSFDLPWPPARNPWNPAHFTGGSSSGSGAAVAAGFTPAALGSDTGGSVRVPAALCGITGFKPTFGLVPTTGVIPNSYSFDHVGPMAWTVEDCAILMNVLANDAGAGGRTFDYTDGLDGGLSGQRVGVLRHFWEEDERAHPELAQAMEDALRVLQDLGAQLVDVRVRPLRAYDDVKRIIAETEIFCVHQRALQERPQDFGQDFLGRTLTGALISATDYVQAQRLRQRMLDEFDAVYRDCDLLVTVAGGPAPRMADAASTGYAAKWKKATPYMPFSIAGGPALAQCIGYSSTGLPLSMQIAGRRGEDAAVLRAGHAYESATPWRAGRPDLKPGGAPVAVQLMPLPDEPLPEGFDSAGLRGEVALRVREAGLTLTDEMMEWIMQSAPYVRAAARRMWQDFDFGEAPARL
jgi:aspartyl-tRNA(Asn)/glutamyl-tRNA(Gln) amidotransferase subunit A